MVLTPIFRLKVIEEDKRRSDPHCYHTFDSIPAMPVRLCIIRENDDEPDYSIKAFYAALRYENSF